MKGLCECGCGEPTTIAKKTDRRAKQTKGESVRFVKGHNIGLCEQQKPIGPSWRVDHATGCWIWTGPMQANGYGCLRNPVRILAHRWSYEHHIGAIPAGLQIDHLCRNRRCVNPEHLQPVTARENSYRGVKTKLSDEQVVAIRASHETSTLLAARFGVSPGYVSTMRSGRRRVSA